MAKRVTFEIVTKAQTAEIARLRNLLQGLAGDSKKLSNSAAFGIMADEIDSMDKALGRAGKTSQQVSNIMGKNAKKFADLTEEQKKNVESLETEFRDLGRTITRLDSIREKSKNMDQEILKLDKQRTEALRQMGDAQRRLNAVRNDPRATTKDIDDSIDAYRSAKKSVDNYEESLTKQREAYQQMGRDVVLAEQRVVSLEKKMSRLSNTMSDDLFKELMPKDAANRLLTARDSVESLGKVFDVTFKGATSTVGKLVGQFNLMRSNINAMTNSSVPQVKELRNELEAMAKLDAKNLTKNLGGGDRAGTAAVNALKQQADEVSRLHGQMARLDVASTRWAAAELQSQRAVRTGSAAMKERTSVTRAYTNAMSTARSAETTLVKDQQRLLSQQREIAAQMEQVRRKSEFAQSNLVGQRAGSAAYKEAEQGLNQWREAYARLDAAMDQNTANLRQNQAAMNQAQNQVTQIEQSQRNWASTMSALQSTMTSGANNRQIFTAIVGQMQAANRAAMQLVSTISGRLRSAISGISGAMKSGLGSAGSIFSGLQRALQSASNGATNFANNFVRSMDRSRASMMELYAAGFSLMMLGQQAMQFGTQMFRTMGRGLDEYMSYEKMAIQAAVAGASPIRGADGEINGFNIDRGVIDDLVFGLQRGMEIPWLDGQSLPVTFDATELAQGLYYYSSAIGVPITADNQDMVGATVATIMQAAAVTNTSLESAIKGVMNVAMEFGMDPRNLSRENSEDISKVAAQMAYLSNISTMEMTDIVETFKMLGPMAHILSGDAPGSGLNESFLLTFLGSELGLRGGNVGRGINQLLTGLLDPSAKTLEKTGQYFGEEYSTEEGFRDLFFVEGSDKLIGGVRGLFETLATIDPEQQASMLSSLFTTNATRSGIAIIEGFNAEGFDMDQWLADMEGDSPFEWLEAAAAESMNSVSGWFAFMKNMWFQVQRAIIQSIQGPLMGAFRLIGEVFAEIAEAIDLNPNIGRAFAGILTAVASVATIVGGLMAAAGAVLLLGRAFAMAGGFILPFVRFLAIAAGTGLLLLPVIAAIGIAVGVMAALFKANIFGVKDAWDSFSGAFSDGGFDTTILPMIERVMNGIAVMGRAFEQFINGIVLGMDVPMNDLFASLQKLFGPMLGNSLIDGLMRLRAAIRPTMNDFMDFGQGVKLSMDDFRDAGLALQGFFEILLLGRTRLEANAATMRLGELLGIDNLPVVFASAAAGVREFLNVMINGAGVIIDVWTTMMGEIWTNIGRIFGGGFADIFDNVLNLLAGVVTGIASTFTAVLSVIGFVVAKIADFADGMRKAEASGRTFMGMTVSVGNAVRALGVVIGVVLGARLLLMFSPIAAMMMRLLPILFTIGGAVIGLGGKFIIMAAQIAVATLAFAAQMVVMVASLAIKAALAGANAILGASQAAAAASAGAQAGATGILSVAMTFLTTTTFSAATAMGFLVGTLVIVGAIIFGVIAGLLAIAGAVTAIAGVMILAVGFTEGWGAALAALIGFLAGVWAGLQVGITAVTWFIEKLSGMMELIGMITGVGDAFIVMGLTVGLAISGVLLIITALGLAVVGLGMVVAGIAAIFVMAFVGMAAAVAIPLIGIALLMSTLMGIEGPLNAVSSAFEMLGSVVKAIFNRLGNDIKLAMLHISDTILNTISDSIRALMSLTDDMSGKFAALKGLGNSVESLLPEQSTLASDFLEDLGTQDDISTVITVDAETTGGFDSVMGMLDKIGLGDAARSFALKVGIDLDDFDMGDLSSEKLTEFLELPESSDYLDMLGDYELTPFLNDYQKDLKEWEFLEAQFNESRKMFGLQPIDFESIMARPVLEDYLDMGEMMLDGEVNPEELQQKVSEATQSVLDYFKGMDLAAAMRFHFDLDMGKNGKSVASTLVEFGDKIIENAGDAGPWLNTTELLADAAIMGELDTNVFGKNLHTALEPALRVTAEQTGIAYEELIKGIPKFVAPPELMNFGMGEFMENLNQLPQQAGMQLDQLGVAQGWTEFGLDWNELVTYGVGKAAEGLDWNLVDYIMESFNVSRAEATQALADAGIMDPDIVGSAWLEDTEMLALSMNGQLDVLTEEMYATAQGYVAAAGDAKALIVSESELAAMSPQVKAYLDNLGITFVLDDSDSDILSWGDRIMSAVDEAINGVKDKAKGAEGAGQEVAAAVRRGLENNVPSDGTGGSQVVPPQGGVATPNRGITQNWFKKLLGGGSEDGMTQAVNDAQLKANEAAEQIRTTVQETLAEPIVIDGMTLDFSGIDFSGQFAGLEASLRLEAASAAQAFGQAFKSAMAMAMSTASASAPTGGYMSGNGGGMGTTGSGSGMSIKMKVELDKGTIEADLSALQSKLSYLSTGSFPIKVDVPNFAVAAQNITDINTLATNLGLTTHNVNVAIPSFVVVAQNLTDIRMLGEALGLVTYNLNVAVPNFPVVAQNIVDIRTLGESLGLVTYNVNVAVPAFVTVSQNLTDIRTLADNVVGTFTVTVAIAGYASVASQLGDIKILADNIVGTYTATVVVNAGGALISLMAVQGALNNIDGRVATSTINVNTVQTTTKKVLDFGTIKAALAVGGPVVKGSPYLVGEEGMEVFVPNSDGYVFNNGDTNAMMSGSSMQANPFASTSRQDNAAMSRGGGNISSGDTYNFYGDITIQNPKDGKAFFEEVDRRTGKQTELAKRGMRPVGEVRTW